MNRVMPVRSISVVFSHRIFCATGLCFVFTRLVYGVGGVSAVVTVPNRAGQASLEIWLGYSSEACFPENTISARCWGNSALFRTTVAVRNCGVAHCPPTQGNAA